jgi:hypothetical protein
MPSGESCATSDLQRCRSDGAVPFSAVDHRPPPAHLISGHSAAYPCPVSSLSKTIAAAVVIRQAVRTGQDPAPIAPGS